MYVHVIPASVSISVTLTPEEAVSLSHRLNVGRNALANAPESFASGKVKPRGKKYADKYGVTSADLAANSGGTLEALQMELASYGFGPVKD